MAPREAEDNAYAKFWGDKQRALWYVIVFSGVVNFNITIRLWTCTKLTTSEPGEQSVPGET